MPSPSSAALMRSSPPSPRPPKITQKHSLPVSIFPQHFTDYRKMLELSELDIVLVGVPNVFA